MKNYIPTFDKFLDENLNEKISFEEIRNKYEKNPYGIGAESVEFIESPAGKKMLVMRFEDSYSRKKTEDKLKSIGYLAKKMTNSTGEKGLLHKYELNLFESEITEELINEAGTISIGITIADDLTDFLKNIVITKSKGYVHNERDAALLLYDVLKTRYKIG